MGILQARILEWVAMLSSRASSYSISYGSCIAGGFFTAVLLGSPEKGWGGRNWEVGTTHIHC